MDRQLARQVVGVHVDKLALAADAADLARVPVGHAEAAPLVAHEPVEADAAPGAQVHRELLGPLDLRRGGQALRGVLLGEDAVHGSAVAPGLPGAPLERLGVQVGGVVELAPGREVALDVGDQPLDLALRERMVRLAEPRPEPDARHEGRVVHLPDRPALDVAPGRDAPHVVRQDVIRHAHDHEGVDHAYEEVLLPGVREELDVGRSAMVAHHREARYLCLLYTSPSPRDPKTSRMPSSA